MLILDDEDERLLLLLHLLLVDEIVVVLILPRHFLRLLHSPVRDQNRLRLLILLLELI